MTSAQISQSYVKVNGSALPAEAEAALELTIVEQSLGIPSMCTLTIHDPSFEWANSSQLQLGVEVHVSAQSAPELNGNEDSTKPLFKGEIVAIEPEASEGGESRTVFRCYDKMHRMQRKRVSKAYLNVKASDVVRTLAGNHSLGVQVDATREVHEHLYQDNLTDYEFLMELTRKYGYLVRVDDGRLLFKMDRLPGAAPVLEYQSSLLSFRPRLTLASQFSEVQVKGWDAKKQQPIMGKAKPDSVHDHVKTKRGAMSAGETVHHAFVPSQGDGDEMAKGLASDIELAALQGEGTAIGNPAIAPGAEVEIRGLGSRFDRKYRVTKARHVISGTSGYKTEFTISGQSVETLTSLILGGAARGDEGRTGNLSSSGAIGIVTNTKDPEKEGRVKVKFPMFSDDAESAWARIAAPSAGSDAGLITVPDVGEEVLVLFPRGDINYPIVIGSLWSGKLKVPKTASDATEGEIQKKQVFRSRKGHELLLDDTQDDLIRVETHDEHVLVFDSKNKKIEMKTAGGHALLFDDQGGKVEIKDSSGNTWTLEASGVSFSTVGNMELTANGNIKVDAKGMLDLSASGPVNVKGAVVNLN